MTLRKNSMGMNLGVPLKYVLQHFLMTKYDIFCPYVFDTNMLLSFIGCPGFINLDALKHISIE